jgi:hypothetical protein
MRDFKDSADASASSPAPRNLKIERADWTCFRTVEGLQQKAGVTKGQLRMLVLKELTDNALDEGTTVRIGDLPDGGYFVEDDGGGIPGAPERIARLFCIGRPLISTKLLRLPTRGALGNGLRVVAGAVLASNGSLVVITRNRRIVLRPERDGTTTVVRERNVKHPVGTRIEISLGATLPPDRNALSWARLACNLAGKGQSYGGRSSPWWYDAVHFHELITATGARPVRELIAYLDGCTGAKAGEIVAAARLSRAACRDITREQAERLLMVAREHARQVKPERLGAMGPMPGNAYGCAHGIATFGSTAPFAEVPFVVEAWVRALDGSSSADGACLACVNRTPITGDIDTFRDGRDIDLHGCGLNDTIATAPKEQRFFIWFNITTPYMPITSDGKAPDFSPFLDGITTAVGKAVKKARRPNATGRRTQKDVVLDNLDAAIAAVSGDGEHRFNERQVFYALRPIVMKETGEELQVGNFSKIITEYEAEHGEIPLMYREPRGSIYHPHLRETIALGTLMVEGYERPPWTFNKLVYIEKEGFSEALKDVGWPERHDCMLMSSKGFTTRAARDLIDKLAEHDEPITIFCVHDADAAGPMIHQTFQQETKARGARKITIINLGLEPWEALAMGLEIETVERAKQRKPVADYVRARHDRNWEEWLQTHRIELNAMTTPQFIAWLDAKLAAHVGKLIPPAEVLAAELDDRLLSKVRDATVERILREAGFEAQVATAIAAIEKPTDTVLATGIESMFRQEPERQWRDHIEAVADQLADGRSL